MVKTVKELIQNVDNTTLLKRGLSEWRPLLAEECQVYVFGEGYLAKRFDQINFKFCSKNEAKDILDGFKWGHTFLELNHDLLEAYSEVDTSKDVVKVQNEFLESKK